MAFDAHFLSAVLAEIRDTCLGARVEKIHQPSRDTVIFLLRCREGREKLLFAANPAAPRLHLTASAPENPAEPPMFCMLLRKHLLGARLSEIHQIPMERAAFFTFDCTDDFGDPVRKRLAVELMGRTCNLYLLDPEGRIIDCLRRVGLDETARRQALPGLKYQEPEPVEKQDPCDPEFLLDEQGFLSLLERPGPDELAQRLMDFCGGLSPLVCREAALYAAADTDARISSLNPERTAQELLACFREWEASPGAYYDAKSDGTPRQFSFCPIRQYGPCRKAGSFGALLDSFYSVRDQKDALRQKSQTLRKTVQNQRARLNRKLAIQEKELAATYDRERLRQLGDILTANLHRIQKGQVQVSCEDFYDENMAQVVIPLSPTLSPQQNAAKFYKDYTRMKNAEKELKHQLELGRTELSYLQSVQEELNRAGSAAELEEISRELRQGGYLKGSPDRKQPRQKKLAPMRFESTDGYPIYVGRNNQLNEELTFRLARKDDIWCHASKVHGSHVIISCGGSVPPDNTVTQAAQLAAFYSGAGTGQNIPVDVTPVRQVKKLPGGKMGMVIYHSYRTVVVNPYPDIVVDQLNAAPEPGPRER